MRDFKVMQLTVKDASSLLNVSEKTIYRWLEEGKLPGFRLRGQYRFNRAELLEWATAHRMGVSSTIFQETEAESVPLPLLSDSVQAGGIFYRVEGGDRESALRGVVEVMRLPDEVDRSFLWEVLMARERLASTGVGDGVAIPHARNPVVLHVDKPMVALCFLEHPIDFGALDGLPVQVLFTMVSPTARAHLHLLSRLSFALRDAEFRQQLREQASRDALIGTLRRLSAKLSALAQSQPAHG
jgi:PTS system nitrogen regulatory IIA component